MPVLLSGYDLVDRSLLPLLSRAIAASARSNEDILTAILTQMKRDLKTYLDTHDQTSNPVSVKYETKAELRQAVKEATGYDDGAVSSLTEQYWARGLRASTFLELHKANTAPKPLTEQDLAYEKVFADMRKSSQVATANVDTVKPTDIDMGPPIDRELADITKFYMDEHDMSEEDAAMQAAKDLSDGRTFDDIAH